MRERDPGCRLRRWGGGKVKGESIGTCMDVGVGCPVMGIAITPVILKRVASL